MISSGWYGVSKLVLLKYNLEKCLFEEIFSENNEKAQFAEGCTLTNGNKIYQLTYKEKMVNVWDLNQLVDADGTLTYLAKYNETLGMPNKNTLKEGWGLAYKFNKSL